MPVNYLKKFVESLQEGFAFNIMDSLEKVFIAKGLKDSNADLYGKIVKFRDILSEKEGTAAVGSGNGVAEATLDAAKPAADTAAGSSKPVAQGVAETAGEVAEGLKSKAGKSYKALWIAAGVVAVAGGAYALYKNRYPKPAHKEDKVQEEPKKATT